MVKFAHISDVHLGGWRQPQMQSLNFESFKRAFEICIEKKVDFILISGDLFDSAYPPIEILKETFSEFRKLKEAKIPCFIIAGSHDYSISGKTFLDVLEKAGFCKNVFNLEEINGKFLLNPIIYEGIAIYGYPGKKSGLEIEDLRKITLNDSPGLFKILMLHTTIDKIKGNLPIDSIETEILPKANYYAMGHIHLDFQYENFVYPGPIFPNNFQELEDLKQGSFYIVDLSKGISLEKIELKLKEVISIEVEIKNAIYGTDQIISEINKKDIENKIVLLRIKGELESGNISDIKFHKIEELVFSKGAYFLLRNTHELKVKEEEMPIEIKNVENIEEESIKNYSKENSTLFNNLIIPLMNALSLEKQEGEKSENFNLRLLEECKKILNFK
ncbi:exonuclease SbcCD subunit D [Candidatus Woesearchaeota archaeon]|nr:exonuclease SbcCD subunit D [Candidatus Woesearchaeota archaeon]